MIELFGQDLLCGKWFISDKFGHRIPMTITNVHSDAYLTEFLAFPPTIEITASLNPAFASSGFMMKSGTIEKVIFNDPATIVIWADGSKTIVKCQPGDTYFKELGLAMCLAKKFLGNKGNFNDTFKKYLKED